jgi:hypothetical protein
LHDSVIEAEPHLKKNPNETTGVIHDRHRLVAVVTAEHVTGQSFALAVGIEPQAPPGARRVNDADALFRRQRRLNDAALCRPGLAPLPVLPTKAM